jgi:hypothetical protein
MKVGDKIEFNSDVQEILTPLWEEVSLNEDAAIAAEHRFIRSGHNFWKVVHAIFPDLADCKLMMAKDRSGIIIVNLGEGTLADDEEWEKIEEIWRQEAEKRPAPTSGTTQEEVKP